MELSEKYLKVHRQQELKEVKLRKTSAASTLSLASSSTEFVDFKIDDVTIALEYMDKLRSGLTEAWKDGLVPEKEYWRLMSQMERENQPCEKEIVVLKRQKKTLVEDLEDRIEPAREKLEDAYASLIVDKVMSAVAKPKKKMFRQSRFKHDVLEYYQASKKIGDKKHAWCHLLGWNDADEVKAAHIVAKSLQSEETSYLFGVGEADLSSPRNALSLQRIVEKAFDSGEIVLVPVIKDDVTGWKCVVTDKSKFPQMVCTGTKFEDINDKDLAFQGLNRPAHRYLYFRFVITYLHSKQAGNMEWVSQVEAKGHLWASPGQYLRQSLLVSLARKVSDLYLPETFYKNTTFLEADGCAQRTEEEEEDLAMSLAVRVKEENKVAQHKRHADEDDETDEEDASD